MKHYYHANHEYDDDDDAADHEYDMMMRFTWRMRSWRQPSARARKARTRNGAESHHNDEHDGDADDVHGEPNVHDEYDEHEDDADCFSAPVFPTNWYMKPPNGGPGMMMILSIDLHIDEDDVAFK